MPISHFAQLNETMHILTYTNPKSVLDVGVGFGTYGFLAREYLDLWNGKDEYLNWETTIDGIEIFEEYITPVHRFIYSNLFIGNALDIIPTLEQEYDMILIIDVLEHFTYEDGMRLLDMCMQRGKHILISFPRDIGKQGTRFGNEYETHRFQWQRKHFKQFKQKAIIPNLDGEMLVFIGPKAPGVARRMSWYWKSTMSIMSYLSIKQPLQRFYNRRLRRRTAA